MCVCMHISAAVIAGDQHKSRDLLLYTSIIVCNLEGGDIAHMIRHDMATEPGA